MIITYPNDGKGLLYHVVNLLGETVHAYRDLASAKRSLEGDQRIFIQVELTGKWVGGKPVPDADVILAEINVQKGTHHHD